MWSVPHQVRIFLAREPVDMRKSFHGLIALTESVLEQDPLSGHLFVFINRRRDRLKVLYWGGVGYCIWYQQLEEGSYQLPDAQAADDEAGLEITAGQLSLILEGIDLSSVRHRKRFQVSDQHRDATSSRRS
ncbi:IS66 Orf2 like protein [Planctomycetes bacterium Pan216]|uniref:IS66 Orf2 like protein n=1 Tax=Kolteria novifilia TaxID=2527975 RepID=A0A518B7J6_9BACT|nr:IS66 Orf2 like protein [Planctomycetes bacterium Pan216]QDU61693.1 IS66 Orf2 like protein [Planctomycetes bacterium Pan216]QDU62932.1 IS66 Orf2 like protein [Planctomycetes bacterium Pan216]